MNTPSHAILNMALLGRVHQPQFNLAIAIGGIVPDLPIFVFYFWAKFWMRMPERQIWTEGYYSPFWQNIIALFHSIPIALIGVAIAHYFQWKLARLFCLSLVLHSLLDLPVHHDDAHRHFFPFSNYRFISPFSYWDSNHYGNIVAAVEIILVLAATIYGFQLVRSPIGKGAMVCVNIFYLVGYKLFYLK